MSAPPEVTAAFDAALPDHSGVKDWYGIGAVGARWRSTWRGLDVYAQPLAGGDWEVFARTPESIGEAGYSVGDDLATALRTAASSAARAATRYAAKQRRAAARRIARAGEAEAMAALWGQP